MNTDTHMPTLIRIRGEWTVFNEKWVPKYVVTVISKPFGDPEGDEEAAFDERSFLNPVMAWDWVRSWGLEDRATEESWEHPHMLKVIPEQTCEDYGPEPERCNELLRIKCSRVKGHEGLHA